MKADVASSLRSRTPKGKAAQKSKEFVGMEEPEHPADPKSRSLTKEWEEKFFEARKLEKSKDEKKTLLKEANLRTGCFADVDGLGFIVC